MTKHYLTLISLLALMHLNAQVYKIDFSGNGEANTIDSITVLNLIQNTNLTLTGSDTLTLVLPLSGLESRSGVENDLLIYPNPMQDNCRLEFFNPRSSRADISIFNTSGRKVAITSTFMIQGTHSLIVKGLPRGIFIVQIKMSQSMLCGRIASINEINSIPAIEYVGKVSDFQTELKSTAEDVSMPYNSGERILFQAYSGPYSMISSIIPVQSQTLDFEFVSCVDPDSNQYEVVTIGEQTWMAENLRTTQYNDSTPISLVTDNNTWDILLEPAYCWLNNDEQNFKIPYGAIYNHFAVSTGKLCPSGWHVPDSLEWIELQNYLIENSYNFDGTTEGNKIARSLAAREKWFASTVRGAPGYNLLANNSTGFSAYPAGGRYSGGLFDGGSTVSNFWSSSVKYGYGVNMHMRRDWINLYPTDAGRSIGFSVRCMKD